MIDRSNVHLPDIPEPEGWREERGSPWREQRNVPHDDKHTDGPTVIDWKKPIDVFTEPWDKELRDHVLPEEFERAAMPWIRTLKRKKEEDET